MSFSCVFNTALTLPIKPHSSSVSAFTAASPGKRGITRHDEARYEGAYDGSYEGQFAFHGGPGIPQGIWRNLRGGREKVKGVARGEGGWEADWDAVDAPTLLKAANLEKRADTHSLTKTHRGVCRLTRLNKLMYANWRACKDAVILCIHNLHTHLGTHTAAINKCC